MKRSVGKHFVGVGLAAALFALFALLPVAGHAQTVLASTSNFKEDATSRLPISASTDFKIPFSGKGANKDPLGTAEHELLHAIGFARNYTQFADRETTRKDGGINFKDAQGSVLAYMTPDGSHIEALLSGDLDLMRPVQVVGLRASALDGQMLDAAFNWSGQGGLNINVVFDGKWSDADKAVINDATTIAPDLFGSGGTRTFDWTVTSTQPAPEASSLVLLGGLIALGAVRLRRRAGTLP